jgi:S-DNA-T family DNA segregation ATPase FtsK/SpoIIIE
VVVLLLTGATALAWLSVTTFSPDDAPAGRMFPPAPVHNMAGWVGAHMAYWMLYWLGDGSYMLLLFLSAVLLLALVGAKVGDLPWRLTGLSLMVTATSAACFVLKPDSTNGFLEGNGGILGIAVGQFLLSRFAVGGTWLVLLVSFAVAVMLTADNLVLRLPVWGKKIWRGGAAPALRAVAAAMPQGKGGLETASALRAPQAAAPRGKAEPVKGESSRAEATRPDRPALRNDHEVPPGASISSSAARAPKEAKLAPARSALPESSADRPQEGQAAEEVESPYRTLPAVVRPATLFPMLVKPAKPLPAKPVRRGKYQLPGMDMLSEPTDNVQASREASAAEKRIVLQQTLDNFNVEARVLGFRTGPVITLYECSLAPGVKVSQINTLAPDIARALAVPGVRVVSPLPGRDTVGIEVPNLD